MLGSARKKSSTRFLGFSPFVGHFMGLVMDIYGFLLVTTGFPRDGSGKKLGEFSFGDSFKNRNLYISAISIFLYPSIRVRTAPPVSVRVRVSVSFSFTVLCFEFD